MNSSARSYSSGSISAIGQYVWSKKWLPGGGGILPRIVPSSSRTTQPPSCFSIPFTHGGIFEIVPSLSSQSCQPVVSSENPRVASATSTSNLSRYHCSGHASCWSMSYTATVPPCMPSSRFRPAYGTAAIVVAEQPAESSGTRSGSSCLSAFSTRSLEFISAPIPSATSRHAQRAATLRALRQAQDKRLRMTAQCLR